MIGMQLLPCPGYPHDIPEGRLLQPIDDDPLALCLSDHIRRLDLLDPDDLRIWRRSGQWRAKQERTAKEQRDQRESKRLPAPQDDPHDEQPHLHAELLHEQEGAQRQPRRQQVSTLKA